MIIPSAAVGGGEGRFTEDLDLLPSSWTWPLKVGKTFVAESTVRKGDELLTSNWFSGRFISRSHHRTFVAVAVVAGEKGNGLLLLAHQFRITSTSAIEIFKTRWNKGFEVRIGQDARPSRFTRTGYKN
jgi:hypothetical protein